MKPAMPYLVVFAVYTVWIAAILGIGCSLQRIFGFGEGPGQPCLDSPIKFCVWGFLGTAALAMMAAGLNFVAPVGYGASFACMALGLALFLVHRKAIFSWMEPSDALVTAALFLYLSVIPLTRFCGYDTGLYHWPAIKWINYDAVTLGLANLHGRFGFNSNWLAFGALVEIPAIAFNGPHFVSSQIVQFFYGCAIFLSAKKCLTGAVTLSDLFMASTIFPWELGTRFNLNSPSPDLAAMLYTFLALYLIIRQLEHCSTSADYLCTAMAMSAFAITVKLSAAPILVGSCLAFLARTVYVGPRDAPVSCGKRCVLAEGRLRKILIGAAIAGAVLIPWSARGLLLSGCIAYPSTTGCFTSLKWSVPEENVRSMAQEIKAWARSPGEGYRQSLVNWAWLWPWLKDNAAKEQFLVIFIFLGLLLMGIASAKRGLAPGTDLRFAVPAAISLCGILFWFFSAPSLRFSYGFLYSFALLCCCQGAMSLGLEGSLQRQDRRIGTVAAITILVGATFVMVSMLKENWSIGLQWAGIVALAGGLLSRIVPVKHFVFWLFLVVFLFNGKVLERALQVEDWSSWTTFPDTMTERRITDHGVTIFVPTETDECWNAPLPCTPGFSPKLEVETSADGKPRMFWMPRD
jgi:hypothetical protein